MNILILLKCFIVGVVGNLALGPIFILTFNRGAIHGFIRGFASALAASVADGILFLLGLIGTLSLISQIHVAEEALYLFGSLFLLSMGGYHFLHTRSPKKIIHAGKNVSPTFLGTFFKSFVMTILNPLTVGYFAAVSVGIFGGANTLSQHDMLLLSCVVALGTLSILTVVSFVSSKMRFAISYERLVMISHVTGIAFIGFGLYLFSIFLTELSN